MRADVNTQWHKHIDNETLSRFTIMVQAQERQRSLVGSLHKYEWAQRMSQRTHEAAETHS